MVTEKLYYNDPYIGDFSAKVLQQKKDENGHNYLVLNKTAFYPTGGGQPHDTGSINSVPVFKVEEVNGEVRHYIDSPIDAEECLGQIQWDRRFDHMQQHAGQHILSAAFEELYGYKTVSFHLGKDTCTIDLDVSAITEEDATRVEERANEVILENRPIESKWVTADEAKEFPLRKELAATNNIRLVIIPEFDYNGCGGTHPHTTSEVNAMTILHWEKQKNNVRIHFICGNRVRKHLHEKHQVIQLLNDLLNAPQEELSEAATRILEQQKNLEKLINELKGELLTFEAKQLVKEAVLMNEYRIIKKIYTDKDMKELQFLVKNITQANEDPLVILVSEKGDKLQTVCGRGQAVEISMKKLVVDALAEINGRGGGNDQIAQGGGEKIMSSEAFMEKMFTLLKEDPSTHLSGNN